MSINSALLAGTAGLAANSTAMAAISDNIANVNTIGYKRTQSLFTPLVKAGDNTVTYNAGGVQPRNRQLIGDQGMLQSSSSSLDLAVSGDGFFVVATNAGNNSNFLFTRAGSFNIDAQGNVYNSAGYYLQGWPVAADGTVSANPSDLSQLRTVNVAGLGGAAQATSEVRINANVRNTTPVSAAEATYDATNTAVNMASGAVTPDFQTSIQVYDTQGSVRTVTLKLLKSATPNQWHAEMVVEPATDVTTGANLINGQIATGVLAFDSDGRLDAGATTIPLTLDFLASDTAGPLGATNVQWSAGLGIGAQSINFDLGDGVRPGGFTQFDNPSVVASSSVNGAPPGDLTGIEVDKNGFVIARFTNGTVRAVYQVPVATFINPNGLMAENGGAFSATTKSGVFNLKQPGSGGGGLISSRTLESSNVDLATEFTSLITTQRAYSASSKIITTADEMLDELIRMKR